MPGRALPVQTAPSAGAFLAAVADPERPTLGIPIAVVIAHPDDEAIGCGALLKRLADTTIIHVTDGAPRNMADAEARGFATARAYALARRSELETAMRLVGIAPDRLISLDVPDQQAAHRLVDIAKELARRLNGYKIVLTHAYEGGHPDHDATAFAVHAACRIMGARAPTLVEMPLYRAGPQGWIVQDFASGADNPATIVALQAAETSLKKKMFEAYVSQRQVLELFEVASERFRPAPDYDFSILPNRSALLYEQQDWGMSGLRWLELARAASAELGVAWRR